MTPLLRSALIVLPLLFGLTMLSLFNPKGDFWLTVEFPKAQCEAYDPGKLANAASVSTALYAPEKLDRLIREPQNTLSNLAYCWAGLAIVVAGRKIFSLSLGWGSVFLGLGSGAYHASLLPEWRLVDILGVYVVLFSVVGLGVAAVWRIELSKRAWLAFAAVIWVAAVFCGIFRNDVRIGGLKVFDSTYVVVGFVTAGFLLGLLASRRAPGRSAYWRVFTVLSIFAAIAFTGGLGDRFGGFWASPEGLVQGHAVWHTFGALALIAVYELFALVGFDRSTLAAPAAEM